MGCCLSARAARYGSVAGFAAASAIVGISYFFVKSRNRHEGGGGGGSRAEYALAVTATLLVSFTALSLLFVRFVDSVTGQWSALCGSTWRSRSSLIQGGSGGRGRVGGASRVRDLPAADRVGAAGNQQGLPQ